MNGNNLSCAFDALGKVLDDKNTEILCLKFRVETLEEKIKEKEAEIIDLKLRLEKALSEGANNNEYIIRD